nr:reverse transcriptase domain-containing protein [Tanacetum cinerariifolium]
MLFPFSLAGAARRWLKKEPPHSILTWEDVVSKFINEFFPPSRTTNLRNEISNFQQHFDESFHEAWDHYKYLLRTCPHHGFTELHQLDTFYNALNPVNQDFLNSAMVATFWKDVLKIPASIKVIEEICVTCGGAHPYYQCLAADGNTFLEFQDNIQGYVSASVVDYNQGAARRWLKKEPPHSILTWEDVVSKFINEFFPPSRTTNLRNEISNFQQHFDESFHEAWDHYKYLLRTCPHHGFTELHQLDTFYNALNPVNQDFLNSAMVATFWKDVLKMC